MSQGQSHDKGHKHRLHSSHHSKLWSNLNTPSSCMWITTAVPPRLLLNYQQKQNNTFYLLPKRVDLAGNTKMVCISFTSTGYPDVTYDMFYKPIHEKMYIPITNHSCLQHSDVYNDVSASKCVLVWHCAVHMHVCVREYISFSLRLSFSYRVYIALVHVVYQESQICMCTFFSFCKSVCCWHDNTSQTRWTLCCMEIRCWIEENMVDRWWLCCNCEFN